MAETVRYSVMPHNLIDGSSLKILRSLSMSNVKHQVSSTELSSDLQTYQATHPMRSGRW